VVNKKPNATNMQTNRRVEFIVLEK
jgi:flagellar motor protein MotB